MKTGAPRSQPGAPDPRRDVETILARHFIVLPPAVQFDINEEFLSEEELSHPEPGPAADLAVEPAEQEPPAPLAPPEPVLEAELPADRYEASPPSVYPTPPWSDVSWASAPTVDPPPASPVVSDVDDSDAASPSLSIAELLENSVAVDWSEAVAIARRVCQALARDPAAGAHLCLVDPRHIEITQRGDVRVLTDEPGSDPHVKQVGRILRALLEGRAAPVQLRLLASQAAFEVPVFVSVDEFSDALSRFERPDQPDAIRMAFKRGLEAKFATSSHQGRRQASLPAAVIAYAGPVNSISTELFPSRVWRSAPPLRPPRAARSSRWLAVAGSLLLVAAITVLWIRVGIEDRSGIGDQGSGNRNVPISNSASRASSLPPPAEERSAPPPPVSSEVLPRSNTPDLAPAAPVLVARSPAAPVLVARASSRPPQGGVRRVVAEPQHPPDPGFSREIAPVSISPAPVSKPLTLSAESPDAAARQGATLLASGRSEEAQLVFDSIILANPLYQLDAARSTPEARAALEASRRVMLPALARRDYMDARASLDAGDYDRALSEAGRIETMLATYDGGASVAGLRSVVEQLLARAAAVKAREEERVYTDGDEGVIPPAPLSRQLPAAPPPGVTSDAVGTLEMLISQAGEVEAVKLHTPLNRYHERMIVSAAKAWRYTPASKDGKPVRFRLITSINLPER